MNSKTQDLEKFQVYDKEKPFNSQILQNIKLSRSGSQKDTRHISIDLKNSGISYIPGDSLCVYPVNAPELVEELLGLIELKLSTEAEFHRFSTEINITRPSNKLYKVIEAKGLDISNFAEKFNGYSVVAILKELKAQGLKLNSEELAENSSKLQARAYSIASSLKAHPEQVDLCISRVEEEINGQKILGVCSNYICNRVPEGNPSLRIYVHNNDKFRLPLDPKANIIMVGPGTGIAPFRAFIEERNYQRQQGLSVGLDWLFFGDQRRAYDFLYEEELLGYEKQAVLRLSTAFSRDQEQKIYVQNRLKENSKEIYAWLKSSAYFYVCGDARRMAKDVDAALREILSENGEDAESFIQELKNSGRYCRDVY